MRSTVFIKNPVSSLLTLSAAVSAVVISAQSHALEPAVIQMGMFDVVPSVTLEQRHDDNIFSQSNNEKDSWVTILSPSVQAAADFGNTKVELGYQHIAGSYASSSDDDYNDNSVTGLVSYEFNSRNQIDLSASYLDGHEDRGTGFSQGAGATGIDEPDTYEETTIDAEYIFGSDSSRGRLVFNVGAVEKEYTNHRDSTRGRDRDSNNAGATFYWNVGGRTNVLVEGSYTDIDYVNDPAAVVAAFDTLDSEQQKYSVGVTWEATGKTQGTIKVGQRKKDFDDSDRDDFSGSSWEADVQWSPKTYSVVTINSAKDSRETNGTGSFIDSTSYGVTWQHAWSNRFNSSVFYSYDEESYEDDPAQREDETSTTGVRFDYSMRRWLDLGLSFTNTEKDSNITGFDFDRNQVALHLSMSL